MEPAASDQADGTPLDLLKGLGASKVGQLVDKVVGVGGASLAIPRSNDRNLWHIRLAVSGVEDRISAWPASTWNTHLIRLDRSKVVQPLRLPGNTVPVLGALVRSAEDVGLVRKLELAGEAHFMTNVLAALEQADNGAVAHLRPCGW